MGAATKVKESVLEVLRGTKVGDQLASEAKAAREAHEARVEARAKLEEGIERRKEIPALGKAMNEAQAKYNAEMKRLSSELYAAQVAYNEVVRIADIRYSKGEGHLRKTAHPLVNDNGPVAWALKDAVDHLRRQHLIGTTDEEHVRRTAKLKPLSDAPEDRRTIDLCAELVRANDTAAEIIDALQFAHDELRDLQLEIEVSPAEVRTIIEGLPHACTVGTCEHPFNIEDAVDAALKPKELKS